MIIRNLSLIFFLLTSSCAHHLSVEEIINKHIENSGGYDRLTSIKSIYELFSTDGENRIESTILYPSKVRTIITIKDTQFYLGYDGHSAWKMNPFENNNVAFEVFGDKKESIMGMTDVFGPLFDYALGSTDIKIEYIGTDKVSDVLTHALKVTLQDSEIIYYYLDATSFLVFKTVSHSESDGKMKKVFKFFEDYKDVDGLVINHTVISIEYGKISVSKLLHMEINPDVDESMFNMPTSPESTF